MSAAAPEVIGRYFECVNTEDWEEIGSLFTVDAVLLPAGTRPRTGRAEIGAFYPKVLAHLPVHRDEPTRVSVAGSVITVEIHFTGETALGHAVVFDAVDVFDLEDGRIKRLSNWYDTALVSLLTQDG
jgi:hypothetical protein